MPSWFSKTLKSLSIFSYSREDGLNGSIEPRNGNLNDTEYNLARYQRDCELREAQDRADREAADREATDRAYRESADREAADRASRESADREAADRAYRDSQNSSW